MVSKDLGIVPRHLAVAASKNTVLGAQGCVRCGWVFLLPKETRKAFFSLQFLECFTIVRNGVPGIQAFMPLGQPNRMRFTDETKGN